MEPIRIDPAYPGAYYSVFYAFAVFAAFVLLTWEGKKKGFPILPWWLIVATSFLFFIIGTQFIKYGYNEWQHVLRFESLNNPTGRSVLGGLILGTLGLLLVKNILRFPYSVVDTFALVIPLGLAIQRIGCLMVGCCFGTPAAMPWAVQYNSLSPAFRHQIMTKIIPTSSLCTLPVHPVQAYDMLCCIVIFIFIIHLKSYLKKPGSLFGSSLLLFGCSRFFLEFVRAESKVTSFFINYTQMALLVIIPALTFWIIKNERNSRSGSTQTYQELTALQHYGYFIGLLLFFGLFSKWLNPLEIFTLNFIIVPTFCLTAWKIFKSTIRPTFRIGSLCLILVALVTMSQTFPEYSPHDSTRLNYNIFSLGTISGAVDYTYKYNPVYSAGIGGCGGPSGPFTTWSSVNRKNNYSLKAIGFSKTIQESKFKSMTYGINGSIGSLQERIDSSFNVPNHNESTHQQNFNVWGVNPYFQYNWKGVGLGTGFYFGNLATIVSAYPPNVKQFRVLPSFNVRLGQLSKLFFEYRFGTQFPSAFPAQVHQLSLGLGFGSRRGGNLRIGTASGAGFFVSPIVPLGKNLIVEALFGGGGSMFASPDQNAKNSVAVFNLHYKFGINERHSK